MKNVMEHAVTVSQVNRHIKNMFLDDYVLNRIAVKGEVSNCKYHSSGHIYFTLKDANAAIACVMFSSKRRGLGFRLTEGQSVVVYGSVNVYERDGRYQLYAEQIAEDGIGRLYEEYERIKKRLLAEGLFDESRKKELPRYISSMGVVTAATGAVIQDICNVSARRNPYVQIYLYPAKVQGKGAAESIISGIHYFDQTDVDVIIIGRGGGSVEDLWCFNDERLARAIAAANKPVISAVGHETDTTISDLAADRRAPTPSAAAELAVYPFREVELRLQEYCDKLNQNITIRTTQEKRRLHHYLLRLQQVSPEDVLRQQKLQLDWMRETLCELMEQRLKSARHQLALYAEEMKGLSPLEKLQSGYAYATDEQGRHIDTVDKLSAGQSLNLSFIDGQARTIVEEIIRR